MRLALLLVLVLAAACPSLAQGAGDDAGDEPEEHMSRMKRHKLKEAEWIAQLEAEAAEAEYGEEAEEDEEGGEVGVHIIDGDAAAEENAEEEEEEGEEHEVIPPHPLFGWDIEEAEEEEEVTDAAPLAGAENATETPIVGPKVLDVGTKIEANYKAAGRWYKGKVSQANSDGTYDIQYIDGDHEEGVGRHLIRLRASVTDQDKEAENEPNAATFKCSIYIGPSKWAGGIGIVAGKNFNPEEPIDMGVGVPLPNVRDEQWQLDNYAYAAQSKLHSLAVMGVTMLFNHKDEANTAYFYDPEDHTEVEDTLSHPFSTHHPIYHMVKNGTTIAKGQEIFSHYGTGEGWFGSRNITPVADAVLANLPLVSDEELASSFHCLAQVVIGDSDLPFAGKGIFAERRFTVGEIVTVSPAVVLPRFSVAELGEESLLQNYCVAEERSSVCLLPIGLAGVINHAEHANVAMEWHEWGTAGSGAAAAGAGAGAGAAAGSKLKQQLALNATELLEKPFTELYLGYRALRNISAGEEITVDYGRVWSNDWQQYLTHLVHFLELKHNTHGSVDLSSLHLPLFRSFIAPPPGLFPSHWSVSEEEWSDHLAAVESVWDVAGWEKEAREAAEAEADMLIAAEEEGEGEEGEEGEGALQEEEAEEMEGEGDEL